MAEISQVTFDASVQNQVALERLKANAAKGIIPFLREIDRYIRMRLSFSDISDYRRDRLNKLLKAIDEATDKQLKLFAGELREDLRTLSKVEAAFEAASINKAITTGAFEAVIPSAAQLNAAIAFDPMSIRGTGGGSTVQQAISHWNATTRQNVVRSIRQGAFEGQTNAEIVRNIRGTAPRKLKDGVLGQTYRQTEALVRTSIQQVASTAKTQTYIENGVKQYQWISTLDARTTEICQGLSNRVFPVGDGPVPPAHWNCRSTITPLLPDKYQFLNEDAKQASTFGPVDADLSYYQWLDTQSAEFQDFAIGPTYGKLFRNGGLSPTRFQELRLDKNFKPLTLDEMREIVPGAFKKANI